MYSKKDKKRAIELYYQYEHSWRAVVRKLGYPSLGALKRWIKEYEKDPKTALAVGPKSRQPKYSREQQKAAVDYYFNHGQFIRKTVKALGYPGRDLLRKWLLADSRSDVVLRSRTLTTQQPTPQNMKVKAVEALHKREKSAKKIAEDFRVSRETLYKWKRETLRDEFFVTASTVDDISETDPKTSVESTGDTDDKLRSLKSKVKDLELQNDILRQVNGLLKKELGINQWNLTNAEKTRVIDALRTKYQLTTLLIALQISKSSYFYQRKALNRQDKYANVRPRLHVIFSQSYESYGYRRMQAELAAEGSHLSEKVIRRLMSEEGLAVTITRCRKYNSYAGEITPSVPNLLARDFTAEAPNQKWVTDITEFSIQVGKIYLSPIIDCFDGQITSWSIGTNPNAELVNTMLAAAAKGLPSGSQPIVHSDRGAHYRWPGWIELMSRYELTRSMSKKGSAPDNAQAESFFGHLKMEFFYNRDWRGTSKEEFISGLDSYIEWYNTKRRKISLGGKSSEEYRHSKAA